MSPPPLSVFSPSHRLGMQALGTLGGPGLHSCLNSSTLLVLHQWLCNNYEFLFKYFPLDPDVNAKIVTDRHSCVWVDGEGHVTFN